jgi:hypothetical protein
MLAADSFVYKPLIILSVRVSLHPLQRDEFHKHDDVYMWSIRFQIVLQKIYSPKSRMVGGLDELSS